MHTRYVMKISKPSGPEGGMCPIKSITKYSILDARRGYVDLINQAISEQGELKVPNRKELLAVANRWSGEKQRPLLVGKYKVYINGPYNVGP